jgi:hypothetical protein
MVGRALPQFFRELIARLFRARECCKQFFVIARRDRRAYLR